ncbi:MAG: hypothetical protein GU347_03610 [Desulfurococcales archaeon]|nr:hypothetical protein [Desulfurococcales archaeon]
MNYLLKEELKSLTSRKNSLVIITHRHADLDAIASALSLKENLISYTDLKEEELFVIFPEGASLDAVESLRKCDIELRSYNWSENIDPDILRRSSIIVLDTASEDQLPSYIFDEMKKNRDVLLIDHHQNNTLKAKVFNYYWDPTLASISELIVQLFDREIQVPLAKMLFLGILTDSSRFLRASSLTFKSASKLAKIVEYENVRKCLVKTPEDRSLRLARLKAMQRTIIEEIEDRLITVTYVSSYESDVADFLLKGGSDVSVVFSPKKDQTRVVVKFREGADNVLREKVLGPLRDLMKAEEAGHKDIVIFVFKKPLTKGVIQKYISEFRKAMRNRE